MSRFAHYARYYDLLYRDKPYREEANYVRDLILMQVPHAHTIVELGCGTGAHAEHLAQEGMRVHGVDLSQWMLQRAAARQAALPEEVGQRLLFSQGDVRDVRLGMRADAVISLFHVVSYQSENADLRAMFLTARDHLASGGVFVFDAWFGPAVLTDRPTVRLKEFEDDELRILRIAEPQMHAARNLVDVRYTIIGTEKRTGAHFETVETHRMRYLFSTEIEMIAAQTGFTVVDAHEWMNRRVPGFDSWSVCFTCRV